jgi:hypothetical protein
MELPIVRHRSVWTAEMRRQAGLDWGYRVGRDPSDVRHNASANIAPLTSD